MKDKKHYIKPELAIIDLVAKDSLGSTNSPNCKNSGNDAGRYSKGCSSGTGLCLSF